MIHKHYTERISLVIRKKKKKKKGENLKPDCLDLNPGSVIYSCVILGKSLNHSALLSERAVMRVK